MKEIVLIFWDKNNLKDLSVYAERDNVEHKYPYSHRVAKSWIEMFEIMLKEYPEDIEIMEQMEIDKFKNLCKNKNFLLFIDENGIKKYISSVPVKTLQKIFPEIFRAIVKGVRLDVH